MLTAEVRRRLDSVTDGLGLAPVEVTVTNRIATVHGDVRSAIEAGVIDDAASAIPGVVGVVSHLAEFPTGDSTEPGPKSESPEFRELLAAARAAGCSEPGASTAVRTVLAIFLEHLPIAERTGIVIHLPPDVRRMASPPRRSGVAVGMLPNTIDALVEAVSHVVALPRDTAHEVVVTVLQTLKAVLPKDFRDIQGKLPVELADLWTVSPVPLESTPGSD